MSVQTWRWNWSSSEMSLPFGYVNSGWREPVVWCGVVPLKGELQPHSHSGKMGGVALYAKHVGVLAQSGHL